MNWLREQIEDWYKAYPESIWPKPDLETEDHGTISRASAAQGRHMSTWLLKDFDFATCKNCKHSEQHENPNGWLRCHGIVYDGGDVEGAMIDGDIGSMFVKPDHGCYGFEPKEEA